VPRHVDHDARREEIADVAAALIAAHGPANVSVRSLAAAAGGSTSAVTHYFADRRELLQHAYRAAIRHARARIDAIADDEPDRLRAFCEAVLPLDEDRRRDWQTWVAFHGAAVGDPVLAEMQRWRVTAFREMLTEVIVAEQATGALDPALDPVDEGRHLLALVHGIASEAAFDADDWPAERQHALLDRALCQLRQDRP
jgi:AcrR family transcriptional regulator